jgi:hypothetical protein
VRPKARLVQAFPKRLKAADYDISIELDQEDGRLTVFDLDEDEDVTTAFTPLGVENLAELVRHLQSKCQIASADAGVNLPRR